MWWRPAQCDSAILGDAWRQRTAAAFPYRVVALCSAVEESAVPDFVKVAELGDVPPGAMVVVELDGHLICLTINIGEADSGAPPPQWPGAGWTGPGFAPPSLMVACGPS